MKLVIEIPDYLLEHAKNLSEDSNDEWAAMRAIANGLPYEQRPHGQWIRRRYINGTDWAKSFDMYVCSNCGEEFSYDAETGISINNYNTCPNCIADMRKERG